MTDTYPFYTEGIDGVPHAGILFVSGTGKMYEFQDPDMHDHYAAFECPRDGDRIEMSNVLDKSVKACFGGHMYVKVPADTWAEMRQEYTDADGERVSEFEDRSGKAWKNKLEDACVEVREVEQVA